jgi:hypothetical protein
LDTLSLHDALPILAGRRFGKSTMAAKIAGGYTYAAKTEDYFNRPFRILIAAPEKALTEKIFDILRTDVMGTGTGFNGEGIHSDMPVRKFRLSGNPNKYPYIEFKDGTEIHTGSGKNVNTLQGDEWDLIISDETGDFRPYAYNKMIAALIGPNRLNHHVAIGTPTDMFIDLIKRVELADPNNVQVWEAPSSANIYIKKESIDILRGVMTPREYEREIEAKRTAIAGCVYDTFIKRNAKQQGIEPNTGNYPYNPNLPTYLAFDFGIEWPVCLMIQEDTSFKGGYQGCRGDIVPGIYVIDEINSRRRMYTEEFANSVRSMLDKYKAIDSNFHITEAYGDPSGKYQSNAKRNYLKDIEYFKQILELPIHSQMVQYLRLIPTGISIVQHWIRNAEGHSHLFIDENNCKNLIDDMLNLRYDTDAAGHVKANRPPIDDNYHIHAAGDALRYFFINRPFGISFAYARQKLNSHDGRQLEWDNGRFRPVSVPFFSTI